MEEDDILLVKKVLKGEKKAYEVIVKKYMKRAYFIALGFTGNHQDALDLSQEAFIKAYRSLRKFNLSMSFYPWFYTILKNLCLNFIKKNKEISTVPLKIEDERELDKSLGPLNDVQRKQTKKIIWRAISELPVKEREIILLRYFQELSYEEISKLTGCPSGTVMSRLYYAKKKLRDNLKERKADGSILSAFYQR